MAGTMQDTLRELALQAIQGAQGSQQGGEQAPNGDSSGANGSGSSHAGAKALAAGVGTAALAPVALKGLTRLARQLGVENVEELVKSPGDALQGAGSNLTQKLGSNLEDKIHEKVDEAGGPSGILKDTVKSALPFGGGGGGGGGKGGLEGVGKGRRMPVQQSVDIGIPIESVYNQFTQFEEWPTFMHRVKRATQEDDCTVSFAVKIWGKTNEFTAKIETQRPDQRIKWKSTQGLTHAGVVTFHELAPNLTRVIVNFDLDPGSLVQKFGRGARHVKRATRADLHRFAAYIEMLEHETGAWRGVIEEGELVEEHDPAYDEQRQYADPKELKWDEEDEGDDSEEEEKDQEDQEEERPRARRRRQSSSNGGSSEEESGRGRSRATSRSSSSRQSGQQTRKRSNSRASSSNGGESGSRSSGSGSRSSGGRSSGSSSGSRSSGGRSSGGRSSGSRSSGGSSRSSGGSSRSSGSRSSKSEGSSRRASASSSSSGRRSRSRGATN